MTPAETAIRTALEAGPTPGPWSAWHNNWEVSTIYAPTGPVASCLIDSEADESTQDKFELMKEANAKLIAACNPAALAELLAELDRLRAERKPLTSGDRLWLWQDGDRYLAFRHEFPCYSPGGDPMTLGNPAPVIVEFRESHDRASHITGD
jgi:hypothetical protein